MKTLYSLQTRAIYSFFVIAFSSFVIASCSSDDDSAGDDPAPNEAPTAVSISSNKVEEKKAAGTVVGTLSTTDPNSGDTHTYKITGGADKDDFTISGNELKTAKEFTFDAVSAGNNKKNIDIESTDAGGSTVSETFDIEITQASSNSGGSSTVYYDPNAKAIFDANCIQCHGSTTQNGGVSLHTFADAKSNVSRGLARMNAGTMPPSGKLPDSDIKVVQDWLDGGLLEKK